MTVLDRGHALVLISGPAGGGKSVLLSQWAGAQPRRGIGAIRIAFEGQLADENQMLRSAFAQLLALDLVQDRAKATAVLRGFESIRDRFGAVRAAFAELTGPCVLVIDNAERADEARWLHLCVSLLEVAPALRIVVATRRSLTTDGLRTLASIDSAVIGPGQLLFTPDEAREVFESVSGVPAPPDGLGEIAALPLSARLLGLAHVMRRGQLDFVTSEREQVADALLSTLVSERVSPEFREFLVKTAVPTAVTADVAARLGWPDDASEHLERAEYFGLGMWESGEAGPSFAYTPALRDALLRAFDQAPVETTAQVRRTVALWAFEHRRPLEALSNALKAKDYALASRLGRKAWFVLARTCAADVVQLLHEQGPAVLVRYPILSTIMALVLTQLGHRVRAFAYFHSAAMRLHGRSSDDDLVERFWTLTVQSLAERFSGRFHRAGATAFLVTRTFDAMTPVQRESCDGATALLLSSCGLSLLFAGHPDDAVSVLEQGMTMHVDDAVTIFENGVTLRIPDDDGGWYHCASTLAAVHAVHGRLSDARRVLDEIDAADPPVAWRVDLFGIMEQVARAHIAVADGDVALARERIDSVAHWVGSTELWPFIVHTQSVVSLHSGRTTDALLVLSRALGRNANSTTSEYAMKFVWAARAAAELASGSRTAAERTLEELPDWAAERHALTALAMLLAGDFGGALVSAQALDSDHGEEPLRSGWRPLALLIAGVAAGRLGKSGAAATALAHATALMREEHTLAPLAMIRREDLLVARELCDERGRAIVDAHLSGRTDDIFPPLEAAVSLTARERAVMRELSKTASTADIAKALFVSPNTVKVQRRSVYRKLGVSTREQALLRAAELGILTRGSEGAGN
ncbi:LuxR C-terminal-related transcriptional regulator [Microbacterium sp. NPDC088619]|uniref:LuxR C-terminal-related transcriptional regulator n=1 Tax=Microbacterium sp. NPDC088619 TaxID=3364196 RepID=UPI0037F2C3CB